MNITGYSEGNNKILARNCVKLPTTWALVANGSVGRIVSNIGKDADWKVDIQNFSTEQESIGKMMIDRAGSSFPSSSNGQSAMDLHSDPVRNNERRFAEHLIDEIARHYDTGEVGALLLVASPRTLGDIRSVIPDKLKNRVTRELAKDLTKLSDHELVSRLLELKGKRLE